jgi:hypothetical protein
MAARSTGIFPRENFNLDAELEITASPTAAAVTLANAKTIRVIVLGLSGGDATVTLGGESLVIAEATDLDKNGVGIAHVRGALCDADNNVSYSLSAGTVGGVYYELVDGPGRG